VKNTYAKNRLSIAVAIALAAGGASASAQDVTPADEQVIEEVIVLGIIVAGEREALLRQRDAKNIVSVVSADGIGKLPDRNAAEAVQRLPGVSVERDQGEGRFVAVRGLPAQWNSTTLNGNRLPTAEEETTSRATAFDFFPTELIKRIEVSKALLPDQEGDAIGGQVNFVTKTAPDELLLGATVATNYNDKAGELGHSTNLVYGDRTDDGTWGWLLNGTFWERSWATDNFEPRRGSDGIGVRRLELRDYTGERTTIGFNGGLEFNPNDSTQLYLRGQYGELADDETHYKHRYRFDKDRVEVQNIHDELITEFTTLEFGGSHEFNQSRLNWGLSSAENEFYYGDIPNGRDNAYFVMRFDQADVGYVGLEDRIGKNYSYNVVDGGTVPGDEPSTHLPDGFSMDPSQTVLAWANLYKVEVSEKDKIVAKADWEWDFSDNLILKFGGKYRDKEREASFSDEFYYWDEENHGPVPTLADFNLIDQPGRSGYDIGNGINYQADFSQVVRMGDLERFWNQNRDAFVLDESESALVSNGAALGRNFDVAEDQYALYGMGTWEPTDRLTVVGGLRWERTETEVRSLVLIENDETGASELVPTVGDKEYDSWLPQLHVRYEFAEDMNLRLALTRSFARPDFGDLNPGGTYLEHDNEFFSGNPDLDPTYSNNFDLLGEWYIGDLGLVSGGVFYKDIEDPIFQGSSVGEYNGNDGVVFFRPDNGDDAKLYGAEFAFVRQFDFLPGFWGNFGVNANLTVMDSEMSIPDRDGDTRIPGQADLLYNVVGYYDDGTVAARLAVNYKDEFIEEHGSDSDSDTLYGEFTSVDFSASWIVNDNLSFFAEVNNITNEPLKYYIGTEARPAQVEYYGVRGQLGLRYFF